LSVAKIGALSGIVMGLVWGIFYGLIAASMTGRFAPLWFGAGSGVVVLIFMPVFGAIMGFIAGAVHAFQYNVFAGQVGGISLEFHRKAGDYTPARTLNTRKTVCITVYPFHFHAALNLYSYSWVSCNRAWSFPAALRSAITAAMNGYTLAAGLPACSGHANRSGCNARGVTIR